MRSYRCAILASLIVVVSVFACFERAFAQGSLPSGWSDTDIGQVGVVGSATYASNVFTVSAGGSALPGVSSDAFHYVYQPLSGDGTIVERVTSISNTGANAAVMIRETLSATSNYLSMDIYNGSVCAGYRTGGGNSGCTSGGSVTLPRWLKVVRSGSIFSGFFSADGTNWTQVGANTTISMAQNVYIGLATTGSTSSAYTVTYDNVSVNSSASPAPAITSVSATTGSIGNQVVISGSGFGASQGSSVVLLHGTAATINSWSDRSITITIPTGTPN